MANSFFHRLGSFLWGGIVTLIVLLAIYVCVGRMLTANVAVWRTAILQELNSRGPFVVEAQKISGEWRSFAPVIILRGLYLSIPGSSDSPLELSEGRIGVDVLNSLRTGALQLTDIVLVDLSLRGEMSSDGLLHLKGFGGDGGENIEQLREFLLNIERIRLRNNQLVLTLPSGEVRNLSLDLQLVREGSRRRMDAALTSTRGAVISVLAQGLGDPFNPDLFSGQVYVDIQTTDLGAVKELIADGSLPVWANGAVDTQLWFDWDKGVPSLEIQLEGRNILIEPQESSWQLPLDRFALQAHLQLERNQWTLLASEVHVENGDVSLTLPRLQVDAGNNTLSVRAEDIALEPISAMVSQMDIVPGTLREVITALHPRGHLSSVQFSLEDVHKPGNDWEMKGRFEAVAVDSFKGAPGAESVSGYMQITAGGGYVLLDSQKLTLDFPAIYREPLYFDDLQGTVNLQWDTDSVRLDSGLLTTQGEEGTAKVLFGLNIPRVSNNIGIEMDLLVGLQNAHTTHRVKYLPYVLNPSSWHSMWRTRT